MYETQRLILRDWCDSDTESFVALNQNPQVMEFFPDILTKQQSVDLLIKLKDEISQRGFGFYACELKANHAFIGMVGLHVPDFNAHFTSCVEIGWRIASNYWRQGLALEAAQKYLEIGFIEFNLQEIVSFTARTNRRSIKLMQNLGMVRDDCGDFYHPKLPQGHQLSLHVLYRMRKALWEDIVVKRS